MLAGLRDAAELLPCALQYEVTPNKTLTDADYIQLSQKGIAHAGVFVSARNVHTPYETISLRDVEQNHRDYSLVHQISTREHGFAQNVGKACLRKSGGFGRACHRCLHSCLPLWQLLSSPEVPF